jgi:hypothetical protein
MRGRKPKPPEIRVRERMAGHRPLPQPVVIDGRRSHLEPPDDLPADGREFWEAVVPTLAEAGVLDGVDVPVLEMASIQVARARRAGRVPPSKAGGLISLLVFRSICFVLWVSSVSATGRRPASGVSLASRLGFRGRGVRC